jgi:hypothetical protein
MWRILLFLVPLTAQAAEPIRIETVTTGPVLAPKGAVVAVVRSSGPAIVSQGKEDYQFSGVRIFLASPPLWSVPEHR